MKTSTSLATEDPAHSHYEQRPEVLAFVDEMTEKYGFFRSELLALFSYVRYNPSVARLMTPATSTHPQVWRAYRSRFIEPIRINGGVRFWNAHAATLKHAAAEFGVPEEIIVAIMGIETIYGRNAGNFRVIDTLTTLAFDYPQQANNRAPFFREQLENYLLFAREQGVDIFTVRGSYAGAIGMPQFMPGSYRRYALDYDQDGFVDLRDNVKDSIGSVANYLAQFGWVRGEPVYFTLPANASANVAPMQLANWIAAGSQPSFSPAELREQGLLVSNKLPEAMRVSLIDLPNGSDWPVDYVLGTKNFYALTRYNRSYFYAMAVVELGAAIKEKLKQSNTLPREPRIKRQRRPR